jgi:general secretion pathway protein D
MRRLIALALAAAAGCATLDEDYLKGRELVQAGQVEAGLKLVEEAVRREPRNPEYRIYLVNQRTALSGRHTAEAEAAAARGELDAAERAYHAAFAADPGNTRAANGLARLPAVRASQAQLAAARAELAAGRLAAAESEVRRVLNAEPHHAGARELLGRIITAQTAPPPPAVPGPALNRQISLELRDTTLREMFDGLARSTGVNFVFDKDVRTDTRVSFFVRNTRLEDLLRMVLTSQQLERKLLNENSMLIYPNTAAKQKDYQELAVRSFYLGNADPKQTLAMLRAVLKSRDLFVDDKLNLLVMRDTPEAIRVAERLIAAQDLAEPEVLLDLEVMEVARGKLLELGIQWPNTLTVLNIVPSPSTTSTTGGVVVTTTNPTTTTTQLTLETLRNVSAANIGVSPNPFAVARSEASDVNLLANPRIRVRNREKARVHIGDRVPVITTTSTANVGVSESVAYLDIGLKLDAEPNIHPDQDVAIKLGLEVSNIVREVKSAQGTLTYQVGTRNTSTVLRVKDGETQILAGLISDEDRTVASKVPGLGDLPIVGRLFGVSRDSRGRTEIVLLVTPRIVRNLTTAAGYEAQFHAGTESAVGAAPLAIAAAARVGLSFAPQPGAAAARQPRPGATAAAAAAPAAPLSRLELDAPDRVSAVPGSMLSVRLSLADAPQDARARLELVFDPQVFAAEGTSQPGRLPVALSGSSQVSLRVVAKDPVVSQLRVENLAVEDAGGTRIDTQPPQPLLVNLSTP